MAYRSGIRFRRSYTGIIPWRCSSLIGFVALLVLITVSTPGRSAAPPEGFADLVEKVKPAVVNVAAAVKERRRSLDRPLEIPPELQGTPFGEFLRRYLEPPGDADREGQLVSLGSGFVIDPAGYVVTNGHVTENAERILVTLADGQRFDARLVGVDAETDIALLKVEAAAPLPHATWGDSDRARVGDWVLAVGNPFGLGGTVTAGIISARGRDIQTGRFDDYLQIDAPINRGNSGGPSFDRNGDVIGINTAIYSPSGGSIGIGFAVPSSVARPVVDELKRHGRIDRGWLGVNVQGMTRTIADSLRLTSDAGALVVEILPGTPAAKVGLRQGDVIRSVDGRALESFRDLAKLIAVAGPGKVVTLDIWRDGKTLSLAVTLGRAPTDQAPTTASRSEPEPAPRAKPGAVGFLLEPIDATARDRYEIAEDVRGALVVSVRPGSPAAEAGIVPGDVVVKIAGRQVQTPHDVESMLADSRKAGRGAALLLIHRHGRQVFAGLALPKA